MATLPTDPTGLFYAALIRRIEAAVTSLQGKLWLLQAPAEKALPLVIIKPITGGEGHTFSGPNGLHTKTIQFVLKAPDSLTFDDTLALRAQIEQALGLAKPTHGATPVPSHWADTLGTRTLHVDSLLPAGDGYEDYDEIRREYIAIFRAQAVYRVTPAAA